MKGQVLFCNALAARCDGAAVLGSAQLTIAGTASIKRVLGIGSHSIDAIFVGFAGFDPSTSTHKMLTVTGPAYASTTTIGASGSPGDYTLTSKGTGLGSAAPAGTVSFLNTTANNALVATANLDPATHGFIFSPSADSPIGGLPAVQFVAAGDFNNDGKPDIAVLNVGSPGTVVVYLGSGDGTFGSPTSYDVGDTPQAIAVADVNHDGKLDLLVCNLYDYTVSILLGNGDGTFQTQLITDTDYYPIFVAVGDFNNDGIPDMVTADWDGTGIGVHIGIGDGTFQPEVTYSANQPYGLVVGDFNEDGIQDIASCYGEADEVDVFLGVGDGTFASAQSVALPNGAYAYWMAGGDLRNSGKSDLVVADDSTAEVYVLLSNGDGTFQTASYPTAGDAEGVSLGDINGDGILDIVVPAYGGSSVSILLGHGDGTFAATVNYPVGSAPTWAALADVNGDGALDIVTSDSGTNTATILLQAQTATATATGVAVYGTGTQLVKASFPGDAERIASQSSTIPLTGTPQTSTSTSMTAAPNPANLGQSVTLTAAVSPHPTGVSLGTVSFYSGESLLGSGDVNSSGVATFSTTTLAAGAHSLKAVYSGNPGLTGSTSNTFAETISPLVSTATALTAAPSPVDDGQSVMLTATVSPAPTGSSLGTVSFYNGSTLLGTGTVNASGVATFPTTSLPAGILRLTAVYSGNSGFAASTSSPFTETVNPGYTVKDPPHPFTVAQGGTVAIKVTVPPLGGAFNQPVTLSATELPPGATASFNPATVTPGAAGAPTVMTIQLAKLAASLSGKEQSAPAGRFVFASLLLAACCLSGARRKRWPTQLKQVALFAVLSFAAVATVGCGGGFLGPPTTHPGRYLVTITGTSGSVHASTTVMVVVR
jgi:hypothetical protein